MASAASRFAGKTLRDLKLPWDVVVPRGGTMIEAGDRVIFFTFSKIVPKPERAFLAGSQREQV
jgi:Trk K+ transport system NAD-binding subunit